jgi:hypothetical protein
MQNEVIVDYFNVLPMLGRSEKYKIPESSPEQKGGRTVPAMARRISADYDVGTVAAK